MEKRTSQRIEVSLRNVLLHHSIRVNRGVFVLDACVRLQSSKRGSVISRITFSVFWQDFAALIPCKVNKHTAQSIKCIACHNRPTSHAMWTYTIRLVNLSNTVFMRLAANESTSLRNAPITNRPITGDRFHTHAPQRWWREESSNRLSTSVSQFTCCRAALPLKTWDTCHSKCKRQESYKGLFPTFLFKLRIDLDTSKSNPGHLSPSLPQGVFGPAWTRCKAWTCPRLAVPHLNSISYPTSCGNSLWKMKILKQHDGSHGKKLPSTSNETWKPLRSQQSWSPGTSTYLRKSLKLLHNLLKTGGPFCPSPPASVSSPPEGNRNSHEMPQKEFCSSALFFPIPFLNPNSQVLQFLAWLWRLALALRCQCASSNF